MRFTQPVAVQLARLLVSYRPLAWTNAPRVEAAVEMATPVPGQPRAWPGRLWPPSGGRAKRNFWAWPCEWHIALGSAGEASIPTECTIVAVR